MLLLAPSSALSLSLFCLWHPRLEGKPAWRECISNRNNVWCCEVESELSCYRACSRGCLHEHLRRNRVYSLTAGAASSPRPFVQKCQRKRPWCLHAALCPNCKHQSRRRNFPARVWQGNPAFNLEVTWKRHLKFNCYINDILCCKKKQKWLPF